MGGGDHSIFSAVFVCLCVCVLVGGVRVRGCDSLGSCRLFVFWFGGFPGVIDGWMNGGS